MLIQSIKNKSVQQLCLYIINCTKNHIDRWNHIIDISTLIHYKNIRIHLRALGVIMSFM